ncbi:Zinc metalloprotease HtpX [Candidatus Hepatincolaceae symbiont of Richtersius coronifer]
MDFIKLINYGKTFLFLAILTALFMTVGYALGGNNGMIFALIMAGGMNFFAYWYSDKLVLKMNGAAVADPIVYKDFYNIVQVQIAKAQLPMPKLYVMQQDAPNAFATGRNPANSAVAISQGLWQLLDRQELSGVIAHELEHIRNRDILISTIVATFAGAISMLANMFMFMNLFGGRDEHRPHPIIGILVMVIAPLAAAIIQMSISRQREYLADEGGGKLCGNPLFLASALNKLEAYHNNLDLQKGSRNRSKQSSNSSSKRPTEETTETSYQGQGNPATAHMFIINPLHSSSADNLFSTHPKTSNRIIRLQNQAAKQNISTAYVSSVSLTSAAHVLQNPLLTRQGSSRDKDPIDKNVPNNPWL